MTLSSRIRLWTSPSCAVPRLRICYYSALAALGLTLVLAHRLVVHEHRLETELSVATRGCQIPARLPIIFVRPPAPRAAAKAKSNTRRAPVAAAKEK
jgi:hypothetical protein